MTQLLHCLFQQGLTPQQGLYSPTGVRGGSKLTTHQGGGEGGGLKIKSNLRQQDCTNGIGLSQPKSKRMATSIQARHINIKYNIITYIKNRCIVTLHLPLQHFQHFSLLPYKFTGKNNCIFQNNQPIYKMKLIIGLLYRYTY